MLYTYEAKDRQGRTVSGTLDASDERGAASQIHGMGYFLMRLSAASGGSAADNRLRGTIPGTPGAVQGDPASVDSRAPYTQPAKPPASLGRLMELDDRPSGDQGYLGAAGYSPGGEDGAVNQRMAPDLDPPYSGQSAPPYLGPNAAGYAGRNASEYQPWAAPMSPGRWIQVHLIYSIWTGISLRDMAIFYRQYSALSSAGIGPQSAISTCLAQLSCPALRPYLAGIVRVVERGGKLSEGMAEYPWIFPPSHYAMVVAGETSGLLPQMFTRLAVILEQEYTLRKNVQREMLMPVLTLGSMFLLPPLYLFFLGRGGDYVNQAIVPLFICLLIGFGFYLFTRWAGQVRRPYHAVLANFPAIGGAVRMLAMARFTRTFASVFTAGVGVPKSIEYAASACGNEYLAERMMRTAAYLNQGVPVLEAFAATKVFPPMVITLVGTASVTGNFDLMMEKAADYFEQEAQFRLHQITVALGVIVTLLVGIRVLFILIGFYSGYFNDMIHSTDQM